MSDLRQSAGRWFRVILANKKTSIPAIVTILGGVGAVIHDWHILFDPIHSAGPIGAIIGGLGLLQAADGRPVEDKAVIQTLIDEKKGVAQ